MSEEAVTKNGRRLLLAAIWAVCCVVAIVLTTFAKIPLPYTRVLYHSTYHPLWLPVMVKLAYFAYYVGPFSIGAVVASFLASFLLRSLVTYNREESFTLGPAKPPLITSAVGIALALTVFVAGARISVPDTLLALVAYTTLAVFVIYYLQRRSQKQLS